MLDKAFIKTLRAQAHHLQPVVLMGSKGLTDAVISAIDEALETHELIKVKASGVERDDKAELANLIAEKTDSHHVQTIGNTFVFYRKKKEEDSE